MPAQFSGEFIQSPEQAENPQTRFNTVIFGHRFLDFDRDQLITFYLAHKIGLFSNTIHVEFKPLAEEKELSDRKTLVIEGLPKKFPYPNKKEFGNFTNGDNDEPAKRL